MRAPVRVTYANLFDTALHRTGTFHLLRHHPIIICAARVTPLLLRIAIRFNAWVTSFGANDRQLLPRSIQEADPKDAF